VDLEKVEDQIKFAIGPTMPDIVFYMRIPIQQYEQTMKERFVTRNEKIDNFEKQDIQYFEKVFDGYEYLAQKYKDTWIKIDALKSIEEIHQDIIKVINERFN
jgi:thymidylate kinase